MTKPLCIADCSSERWEHKRLQMIPATQKLSLNSCLLNITTQDWHSPHSSQHSLTLLKNAKIPSLLLKTLHFLLSPWKRYLEQDPDTTEQWSRLSADTTWLLASSPTSVFMLVSLLHASRTRGRKCRTWHDLVTTESILTFPSFKHHKGGGTQKEYIPVPGGQVFPEFSFHVLALISHPPLFSSFTQRKAHQQRH